MQGQLYTYKTLFGHIDIEPNELFTLASNHYTAVAAMLVNYHLTLIESTRANTSSLSESS